MDREKYLTDERFAGITPFEQKLWYRMYNRFKSRKNLDFQGFSRG